VNVDTAMAAFPLEQDCAIYEAETDADERR